MLLISTDDVLFSGINISDLEILNDRVPPKWRNLVIFVIFGAEEWVAAK